VFADSNRNTEGKRIYLTSAFVDSKQLMRGITSYWLYWKNLASDSEQTKSLKQR